MEERLSIQKLAGQENWATFKFQIEHLLKAKGLWGHVTGEEVLADGASAQQKLEFDRRCERAFSTIVLNIATPQLYLVTSCKTPVDAWQTLIGHFERRTLANKLFPKKLYFRCEMKEGMSINEHLKNMKELTDKIAAVGTAIEEEDQVVTLLGSLPPSYSTIVTALEARIDDLTLTFVQQALINEEQKRSSIGNVDGSAGRTSSALATTTTRSHVTSWRNQSQGDTSVVGEAKWTNTGKPYRRPKCYKCGGLGHIKRNCVNKQSKPVHNAKKADVKSTGNSSDCSDADDFSSVVFVAKQQTPTCKNAGESEWLIDSGASKHMTNQRACLVNYQEFGNPQQVKLGDGRTVDALGVGNIQLEMIFKVSAPKHVMMYNVLFVPKLAGNLFSVGAAVEKGHIVQFGHTRVWIRGSNGQLYGMG